MSSPFLNSISQGSFDEPSSPDDTSTPAMPQTPATPQAQGVPNPVAAELRKLKKTNPAKIKANAQLVAAIARARRARQTGQKFG
jgi:hypothetical protein